ncbi:MAG: peptidylprolyl isomerase [Ignavibacteriales bacterium]|nr:peptidylprolyl isomerase [Ignavibacteriales bacterium]
MTFDAPIIKTLLAAMLILTSQGFAQRLTDDEKEILKLQDQRSVGDSRLRVFLNHSSPKLRYRAAIACANIQDSSSMSFLTPLLKDSDASVRSAAAFALGQIGARSAKELLLEALKTEQEVSVASRLLEALGRIGDGATLDFMVEYAPKKQNLEGYLAIALARFALRNVKSERSVWLSFDLLQQPNVEIQWKALYALWRAAPLGVIDVEVSKRLDHLQRLTASPSVDVRIHLATLMGRSKSSAAIEILQALERAERSRKDWRVQVQVVRSMGVHIPQVPELLGILIFYLDSPNHHLKIASLQAVSVLSAENVRTSEHAGGLREKLVNLSKTGNQDSEAVRGEVLVALGKHFPEELSKSVALLASSESTSFLKSKFLEGLSFNASGNTLDIFLDRLTDESSRVSMAAWDFIKRLFAPRPASLVGKDYPGWSEIEHVLQTKISTSLSRGDMGVSTLVAGALSDSSFRSVLKRNDIRATIVRDLVHAYERFSTPNDVEAMQSILAALGAMKDTAACSTLEKALRDPDRTLANEAAKALERITGRNYSELIPRATTPMHTDYDWQTYEAIQVNQRVVLETNRGSISIQLFKDHAPFTVLNFVKLIKKGFFDGLSFHRVVPNFVIQGGDPRGDGWGGPGYSIRSEFSLVSYDRGTVGVASAGKDTEGCQFFITHSPQPHLDGRYTVFGAVVEGMDVVDQLQVGDRILLMRLGE